MDNNLIMAIHNKIPHFNQHLLKDYTRSEVNDSDKIVGVILSEAIKLFGGEITYEGFRTVLPEERVEFELQSGGVRIATSELALIAYQFASKGKRYETFIYVPYMKDDAITIKSTKYHVQRTIMEKVFSKTNEGISIKVIRSPIKFDRIKICRYTSAVDESFIADFPITCNIHRRPKTKKRNAIDTSVFHYLLCQFGYAETILRFKLNPDDFKFVDQIYNDTEEFDYFVAKKLPKNKTLSDIYLRVRKSLIHNENLGSLVVKLIVNILYILTAFDRHTIDDLYNPTGAAFRIMLGRIVYRGEPIEDIQYKSHADIHMISVNTYLDPLTRKRLHDSGIHISDIYDLFQYIFTEIDSITLNSTHSNLYDRRIDIIHSILVTTIGRNIFIKFYNETKTRRKLDERDIGNILKFNPMMISTIWKASKNIISEGSAYGDNWLLSFGISKTRQTGNGNASIMAYEHNFHPSMAVVESVGTFSKSSPGITGSVNPFIKIDENGTIIRPDDADEIDEILKYLPNR
jgi:hypothetical protein